MQEIFEFLKGFDLHTIISVAIIGWFFSKSLKKEIKEIKQTLDSHGNRLTAIETGLKMFEWFEVKNKKSAGE